MTFEEFLDNELDGLGRYARVLTGDRQQAHDTLAESLIKVQVHWRRIGQMDRPLAYVRRMVTNQFLEERRSWAARMFRTTSPESLPQMVNSAAVGRVEDRSELHTLLGSLPRQERAAIVLRHYLDLPDAEIAELLSCSAGAVRTYISRGFTSLRSAPRNQMPGAEHTRPISHTGSKATTSHPTMSAEES
ncbi:RNA polymerase sigma-70 factor (sigma-E family) [Nakamurella sp. UYEF19]|uniref:sigma-70 family RNA polymerase sigma factor n=1 Tax=Nakamurella sp. UYEF19 TaxID=1756392 RepID=UPI0033975299